LVLCLGKVVRQKSNSSERGANEKETGEKQIIITSMNEKGKVKDY